MFKANTQSSTIDSIPTESKFNYYKSLNFQLLINGSDDIDFEVSGENYHLYAVEFSHLNSE